MSAGRFIVAFLVMVLMISVQMTMIFPSVHGLYVKPSYPDYAPNGMPDFDQKQDGWGPSPGVYTWCCPVAAANSLWWLDSKYESLMFASPVPPPTISDHFPLVTAYSSWDDHDANNVLGFVTNLAILMDTDGMRTGNPHVGTRWVDVAPGIQQYLIQQGVAPMFEVHGASFPGLAWIDNQTEMCQDVELFIEFWQQIGGGWTNTTIGGYQPSMESGHCVTVAGSDPATSQILISDPYFDVITPFPPAAHNDAQIVSHDPYTVTQWMAGPGPYGPQPIWELVGYPLVTMGLNPSFHAFIRGAVATSSTSPVRVTESIGITGYKLMYKETMANPFNMSALIDYQWNFTINKWNGAQWVSTGINVLSALNTGYSIPALATVDLPYYVYLLSSSTVAWGNWLKISCVFRWAYGGTNYTASNSIKLHVHPGDTSGAAIAPPYFGADGKTSTADLTLLARNWGKPVSWTGTFDPTDELHRADTGKYGKVSTGDLTILATGWAKNWSNSPPPG